jgi:RNA polymerase sigma-70 factor (ECF subfamily)
VAAIGESSAQMALRDPDIRLMLRVRDDEPEAFPLLVEQYQHRLVAVMNHVVGNAEEAEDLAQEVFLRVYRARKKYRPRSKFSTWLFTIANNLALGPRPAEQLVHDRGGGPTHRLQQTELAEVIRQALDGLNERQRVAVVLNKFEDMNYADIAEVMGLTTKAVKSLLSRARENLRTALSGYIYMDGETVSAEQADE